MLHVHSKEGVAKRKEALQLKRESQAAAMRAARAAKAARIAERRAAANAASSNAASSPTETVQTSDPSPAPSKKRSRAVVTQEQMEIDARAAHSNAFLDQQMAAYEALTTEGKSEIMATHGDRKRLEKARARAEGRSS